MNRKNSRRAASDDGAEAVPGGSQGSRWGGMGERGTEDAPGPPDRMRENSRVCKDNGGSGKERGADPDPGPQGGAPWTGCGQNPYGNRAYVRNGESGENLPGRLVPRSSGLCADPDAGETAGPVPVRLFPDDHYWWSPSLHLRQLPEDFKPFWPGKAFRRHCDAGPGGYAEPGGGIWQPGLWVYTAKSHQRRVLIPD